MPAHPLAAERVDARTPGDARSAPQVAVRLAGYALFVAFALLVVGCGSSLKISMAATPDCNSCGKPAGYPLTYRVLQVTDPSVVTGMSLTQLWGKEAALLGPALLDTKESFVDPGGKKQLPVEKMPGATAIIVVGNYCKPRGTCWMFVQPLSRGSKVNLLAGPDCLSLEK